MTLFDILGWGASIGLILGYLPQAIQTMRTRKTDDIALPTFLMIGIGGICFMCQGWMLGWEKGWASSSPTSSPRSAAPLSSA